MDRKIVNFIKEQYPTGTRIRLNSMDDPYAPILPGTEGEVDFVDDAGQLHMKWDMDVMVNTNEAASGGGWNFTGAKNVKHDAPVSIVDTEIFNTNQDLADAVMFD